MMKNIKKIDPRLKEETVNEIFKKENNKGKKAKSQKNYQLCHIQKKNKTLNEIGIDFDLLFEDTNKFKCTLIKEKRDGIKCPLNKVY